MTTEKRQGHDCLTFSRRGQIKGLDRHILAALGETERGMDIRTVVIAVQERVGREWPHRLIAKKLRMLAEGEKVKSELRYSPGLQGWAPRKRHYFLTGKGKTWLGKAKDKKLIAP